MTLIDFTRRLDYKRLAGLKSVLGIDLSADEALVVEMKRYGNPFDRFSGSFTAVRSFTCPLPRSSTPEEKGRLLKEALAANEVKTRYAVGTVRTPGVRTIAAKIPPEVEDLHEWVAERAEKLLNLPVPIAELSFSIFRPKVGGSQAQALITFVRSADIAEEKSVMAAAGLELLALGAGPADLVNALVVSDPESSGRKVQLIQLDATSLTFVTCHDGRCVSVVTQRLPVGSTLQDVLAKVKLLKGEDDSDVLVCGKAIEGETPLNTFRPFGLLAQYALAAGVALKAFFPAIHPVDFLEVEEHQHVETRFAQSLFRRSLLAGGAVLLLLLALPMLASLMIQSRMDNVDEELALAGPPAGEVAVLERQVTFLRTSVEGSGASSARSNVAELLHEVARLAPEQIDLKTMTLEGDEHSLLLAGRARSREAVASFLQALQSSRLFTNASLNRLGTRTPEIGGVSSGIYFEVTVAVALETL